MQNLRLILLIIGVLIVVGIYLYARHYKSANGGVSAAAKPDKSKPLAANSKKPAQVEVTVQSVPTLHASAQLQPPKPAASGAESGAESGFDKTSSNKKKQKKASLADTKPDLKQPTATKASPKQQRQSNPSQHQNKTVASSQQQILPTASINHEQKKSQAGTKQLAELFEPHNFAAIKANYNAAYNLDFNLQNKIAATNNELDFYRQELQQLIQVATKANRQAKIDSAVKSNTHSSKSAAYEAELGDRSREPQFTIPNFKRQDLTADKFPEPVFAPQLEPKPQPEPKPAAQSNLNSQKNPQKSAISAPAHAAAVPTNASKQRPDKQASSISSGNEDEAVIVLHLKAKDENPFLGKDLVAAFKDIGMKYGENSMFHYHSGGKLIFTVANMYQPGTFDIINIDNFSTKGITFFFQLGSSQNLNLLEEITLQSVKYLAKRLDGSILDHQRQAFDSAKERQLIQKIHSFN